MYLGTLGLLTTVIGNDFRCYSRFSTKPEHSSDWFRESAYAEKWLKNQYKVGCTISAIIQCTRWRVDPRELPKGVLFPPLDRKYKRYESRKSSSENYQGDGMGVKSVAFEMDEEKDSENKYMAAL